MTRLGAPIRDATPADAEARLQPIKLPTGVQLYHATADDLRDAIENYRRRGKYAGHLEALRKHMLRHHHATVGDGMASGGRYMRQAVDTVAVALAYAEPKRRSLAVRLARALLCR